MRPAGHGRRRAAPGARPRKLPHRPPRHRRLSRHLRSAPGRPPCGRVLAREPPAHFARPSTVKASLVVRPANRGRTLRHESERRLRALAFLDPDTIVAIPWRLGGPARRHARPLDDRRVQSRERRRGASDRSRSPNVTSRARRRSASRVTTIPSASRASRRSGTSVFSARLPREVRRGHRRRRPDARRADRGCRSGPTPPYVGDGVDAQRFRRTCFVRRSRQGPRPCCRIMPGLYWTPYGIRPARNDGFIETRRAVVCSLDQHLGPSRLEPGASGAFAGGDERHLRVRRVAAEGNAGGRAIERRGGVDRPHRGLRRPEPRGRSRSASRRTRSARDAGRKLRA